MNEAKKALDGRGERIRTSDPLVPNQVLYQAEPLPDRPTCLGGTPGAIVLVGMADYSSALM